MSTWVFSNINVVPGTEAKEPNVSLPLETRGSFGDEYTQTNQIEFES